MQALVALAQVVPRLQLIRLVGDVDVVPFAEHWPELLIVHYCLLLAPLLQVEHL